MLTLEELEIRLEQCQAEYDSLTKRREILRVRRYRYTKAIAALRELEQPEKCCDD